MIESKFAETKKTNWLKLLTWASLGIIILWLGFTIWGEPSELDSLFAGLAFAGVLAALSLQRQELQLQREEMKQARHELEGQTEQLRKQSDIAALQTLYTSLPLYNQQLSENWQRTQNDGRGIDTLGVIAQTCCNILDNIAELLHNPVNESRVVECASDAYDQLLGLLCEIFAYEEYADVVFRWEDKVNRQINDPNERLDAKGIIIYKLNEKQLFIIWLFNLMKGRTNDDYIVDNISLIDIMGCFEPCIVWSYENSVTRRAAIRIFGKLLKERTNSFRLPENATYSDIKERNSALTNFNKEYASNLINWLNEEIEHLQNDYEDNN